MLSWYPAVILKYSAVILHYKAVILLLSGCCPPVVILFIWLLSFLSGCYTVIRCTEFPPVITSWRGLSVSSGSDPSSKLPENGVVECHFRVFAPRDVSRWSRRVSCPGWWLNTWSSLPREILHSSTREDGGWQRRVDLHLLVDNR